MKIYLGEFSEAINSGKLNISKQMGLDAAQLLFQEDLDYFFANLNNDLSKRYPTIDQAGAVQLFIHSFMELAKNAHDAGASEMHVNWGVVDQKILLKISDNGKAFPEDYVDGPYNPLVKSLKTDSTGKRVEEDTTGGANQGLKDADEVCRRNGGRLEIITGNDPEQSKKAIILSSKIPKETDKVVTLADVHHERDSPKSVLIVPSLSSSNPSKTGFSQRLRNRVQGSHAFAAGDIAPLQTAVVAKQPQLNAAPGILKQHYTEPNRVDFLQKIPDAIEAQQAAYPVKDRSATSLPSIQQHGRSSIVAPGPLTLPSWDESMSKARDRGLERAGVSKLSEKISDLARDLENIPSRTEEENALLEAIEQSSGDNPRGGFIVSGIISTLEEMNNQYSEYTSTNPSPPPRRPT